MSIIYEALKKVESREKIRPVSKTKRRTLLFALSFAAALLFIIFSRQYIIKIFSPARLPAANTQRIPAMDSKAKEPEAAPQAADSSMPKDLSPGGSELSGYILEGIIYDRESPLAIINGKILKKEDKIDDWKIMNITATSVEMLNLKDNATLDLGL